jgi:hypothetical protein
LRPTDRSVHNVSETERGALVPRTAWVANRLDREARLWVEWRPSTGR